MKVSDVMSKDVEVAESYMMLDEVAELMRAADVGVLPVLESNRLLGVITDRDIVVRAIAHGDDPARTTVRQTMTPESVVVYEEQEIDDAARLMSEYQVRRLPVLDRDGRLVGVLSLGDLCIGAEQEHAADVLRAVSSNGGA